MTRTQFRAALADLGWSQAELGRRTKANKSTVSKWATGKAPVPGTVAAYLELAVKVKALGSEVVQQ